MKGTETLKKIGLICLAVVLAVGGLGVGYATWSDTVKINTTVEMNDFLVGWEDILFEGDNEPDLEIPKDIGKVEQTLTLPETGEHHLPVETVYKKLTIKITGGYPSYMSYCKVTLKNAGTVPAHIVRIVVTPGAGLDSAREASWDANNNPIDWELLDAAGNVVLDLFIFKQLTGDSLVCNQLDPCIAEPVDIWVHVKQKAEECHTYDFAVGIEAIQWNMA